MTDQSTTQDGDGRLFLGGMIAPDTPVNTAKTENAMRVLAYSQVMAIAMERGEHFIEDFRRKYLPDGKVLPLDRLVEWIIERAVLDGEPTMMLTDVPWDALHAQTDGSYSLPKNIADLLRPDIHPKNWEVKSATTDVQNPPRLTTRSLNFVLPTIDQEELYVMSVPVRLGGVLDLLRMFCLAFPHEKYWMWRDDPRIAGRWIGSQRASWDYARIATVVLTGYVPLFADSQVAPPSGRGSRIQTVKNLQLAVFSVRHAAEPLSNRMETWNNEYPEWSYTQSTGFGWDSLQAVRRLLNQPTVRLEAPSKSFWETVANVIDRAIEPMMGVGAPGERVIDADSRDIEDEIKRRMASLRSEDEQ